MALNATFPFWLSFLDSGGFPYMRQVDDLPYDSARGKFNNALLPDGASYAIALLAATIYHLVLVNLDPAQRIQVTWTPTGQPAALTQILGPFSGLIVWDLQGGPGGLTALTLQALDGGPVNYQIFQET